MRYQRRPFPSGPLVYKTAARHLQRRGRRARTIRLKAPEPKTRAQLRVFWFPVVRHHSDAIISVADKYGSKFPSWLESEVDRFGPARWLAFWDPATGKPRRGPAAAP